MKLRNIFAALAVAALTFVGCQEKERFLDEVQVSQSYVAIPAEGGQVEITVTAIDAWEMTNIPEWVTVTPSTGAAGQTKVVFAAEAAEKTRSEIVGLVCAGVTQNINVLQMTEKVDLPITSCDFVNTQGEDGTIYRVKGQVTSIVNTEYGNFYIKDETGTVYVYGCLYEGQPKLFANHGLAVGDVVTVEGPRKDYNGTIELVDVTVVEIVKSLFVADPMDVVIEHEAGDFTVEISNKGYCTVDVDVDWIHYQGLGVDEAMFTFDAYDVMGAPRTGTITFTVVKGDRESVVPVSVTQYGITPDPLAIAEAVKQEKNTWLTVEGVVTGVHSDGIIVTDAAGTSLYGYKATGAKVGDEVTMTGNISDYRHFYQVNNPVVRVIKSGKKFNYPEPKAITEELLAKFGEGNHTAEYIVVTGISDGSNYGAVTAAGYTISPYKSPIKMDDYAGKKVTIKGWALQNQAPSRTDLRILPISVELVEE